MEIQGYIPVIGLEIHVQLNTSSKAFCADEVAYGGLVNTRLSSVSLGLPGALPTINTAIIDKAIKMGLATKCHINKETHFARKNYFYPDLPKGYQITQDKTPICTDGHLEVILPDSSAKRIGITRIHIEEDAGKSIHDQDPYDSLIDLNRAGTPLIEVVSEPDMENAEQAMAYLTEIRKIVRYIEISDGNMEEGSLRCDANISVMKKDATAFGTRNEVKNINSISNVGRAINYEIQRQIELLESGGTVVQATRTWDAVKGRTIMLRVKEEADDYRYFPEPDLQPVVVYQEKLNEIQAELPELPDALYKKYTTAMGLSRQDAVLLTEQREYAAYYQKVLLHTTNNKAAANWMNGAVRSYMNEMAVDITTFPLPPEKLAELINAIDSGTVSHAAAKEVVFNTMLKEPDSKVANIIAEQGLQMATDETEISGMISALLQEYQEKVKEYQAGKTGLLGFFVGQIMKKTQGKADPKIINTLLKDALAGG